MKKLFIIFTTLVICSTAPLTCMHGRGGGRGMRSRSRTEPEADKQYKEMLYCQNRRALYDQKELVRSKTFKEASLSEKEAMLVDHFNTVKRNAKLTLAGKSSIYVTFTGVAPAIFGYRLFRNQNYGAVAALQMTLFGFFGIMIDKLITSASQNLSYLWSLFVEDFLPFIGAKLGLASEPTSEDAVPLEELEIAYVKAKPWLNPALQKKIENKFIELYCEAQKIEEAQKGAPVTELITMALNIPHEVKKLTYDEKKIDELFADYEPAIRKAIKRFCLWHVQSSTMKTPRKQMIYLYGPHGVGKTHAVEQIATALDIPYATIQLGSTLASFKGDRENPGALLEALTQAKVDEKGYLNMILFIDEADKILNFDPNKTDNPELKAIQSFLLTLFDPETKVFKSPYLGTDVDISHLGIILAGNAPLQYAPMANRFRVVQFAPFTHAQKQKLVDTVLLDKILAPYAEESETRAFTLSKSDLDAKDYAAIKTMVAGDDDPGLRTIQRAIEDYIAARAACKAYGVKREDCDLETIALITQQTEHQLVDELHATKPD